MRYKKTAIILYVLLEVIFELLSINFLTLTK